MALRTFTCDACENQFVMDDEAVEAADSLTCPICGEDIEVGDAIHIDHIVPFSKGGSSEIDNLQPAHAACNMRKGSRAP